MPAAAFGLLAFFIAVSIAAGAVAWWALGIRRGWGLVLPILAAFGALYFFGHLLEWSFGPTVTMFGFEVSLAFDLALALVAAMLAAALQRLLAARLTRGAGASSR